jgi:hypothetical protein
MSQQKIVTFEIHVPPDQIVAEAKRWGIEDDVGLQMSPSGAVTVAASTPRGRPFVEHLASVRSAELASGNGQAAAADEESGQPPLHVIQSAAWTDMARLAVEIDAAAASGKRLPGAAALKLARAILALNRDAETTGIVVRPAAVDDAERSTGLGNRYRT